MRFGGLTLLPSALAGLAVCDAVILYVVRRMRKRSSPKPPRQPYSTFERITKRWISIDVPAVERGEAIPPLCAAWGQSPSPAGTNGDLSRKE